MNKEQYELYEQVEIDHLLAAVLKPSRYINCELNSYHKKPTKETVNFCFAFPDLYEIGFSHLGLKLLYSIINNESDATADRVYAPDKDMGELLQFNKIPLYSSENKVSLHHYDIIGFTLQSELTYTNILYMLDLAGIPLLKNERHTAGRNEKRQYPLIIAGGPGTANPEPLADFFDLFFLGEAEEGIVEIKNTVKKAKNDNLTYDELMLLLSDIEGVYIPDERTPRERVQFRKYNGFHKGVQYTKQLIPWQQTTHDRYVYEIMRGCSRGCRFCLPGFLYRPVREKNQAEIVNELAGEIVRYGWEEAALLSLSSADYSCIKPLIKEIIEVLSQHQTDISLPSLRVDSLDDDIIKLLNKAGQNGITIAPEAGTQRLRDIINKDISETQILDLVSIASANNWKTIKLYFMVGLPFETEEDIIGIVALVKKIVELTHKRLNINISLSPFIPKPHTPFQWASMLSRGQLMDRIGVIKRELARYKSVKVKYHSLENSLLECVLSRGDRSLGKLVYAAYKNGAYFDGWDEHFDFSVWEKAAYESGTDFSKFTKGYELPDKLPWENISLGINRQFLKKEYQKAVAGELTPDCRISCTACGICDTNEVKHTYSSVQESSAVPQILSNSTVKREEKGSYKYRLVYAKTGYLKYVTHLDMLRMFHRILRRTGLPIRYTEGFNKHPRINFCPPLSVGVEGLKEFMDIELGFSEKPGTILDLLNDLNITGIDWVDVQEADFDDLTPLTQLTGEILTVSVPKHYLAVFTKQTIVFNETGSLTIVKLKKQKEKTIELKEIVRQLDFQSHPNNENGLLRVKKNIGGASIFDLLAGIYGIKREDTGSLKVIREGFYSQR